jgi:hypothetical protein
MGLDRSVRSGRDNLAGVLASAGELLLPVAMFLPWYRDAGADSGTLGLGRVLVRHRRDVCPVPGRHRASDARPGRQAVEGTRADRHHRFCVPGDHHGEGGAIVMAINAQQADASDPAIALRVTAMRSKYPPGGQVLGGGAMPIGEPTWSSKQAASIPWRRPARQTPAALRPWRYGTGRSGAGPEPDGADDLIGSRRWWSTVQA